MSAEPTIHYTRHTCRQCCHKYLGESLWRFMPGTDTYGWCAGCGDERVLPVAAYWYPMPDAVTS